MATLLDVLGVNDIRDAEQPTAPIQAFRDQTYPQYVVLSFNGKPNAWDPITGEPVAGETAVGFAYDSTGEDPDFYLLNPEHDLISQIKGFDLSSLKQGLGLPLLTTAERDASDEYFGRLIFNTTTNKFEHSDNNGAWLDVTSTFAP